MSSSAALSSLVKFLTRPVGLAYPHSTAVALQIVLEANLAPFFPSTKNKPTFTFTLSSTSAPAPFSAASIAAGVSWKEWMKVLGGSDLHFFVSERCVKVSIAATFDKASTIVLWEQDVEETSEVISISRAKSSISSLGASLKSTLDSVRSRRTPCPSIKLPSLLSASHAAESDSESSDSDSDDASSTFSFGSSNESLTSVSSTSSPVSKPRELPFVSKPLTTLPAAPKRSFKPSSQPFIPRRTQAAATPSNKPKTEYMYQGGSTGVVTGGVMLGGASRGKSATYKPKRPSVPLGPESSNWRRA